MQPTGQVPGPYEDTTCQMVVAYGDPLHPHLQTIRRFRDEVLADLPGGELLIGAYYATAPAAARIVSRSPLLRMVALFGFAYPSYLISRTALALR